MIATIVEKIPDLAKPQRKFMTMLLTTMLLLRGRVNYTNLSRYSGRSEKTFRRWMRQPFDFGRLNQELVAATEAGADSLILALDATFVPKSGKHTFGLGRFWSGTAGRGERGLEVSLVAVVNLTTRTAYALEAEQTAVPEAAVATNEVESLPASPTKSKSKSKAETRAAPVPAAEQVTRVDAYLAHLTRTKPNWPPQVRYLVGDGFYTKQKFVTGVRDLGLHFVGKLRADANLRFPYSGPQKPRGRRRIYDGKVELADLSRLAELGELQPKVFGYTAIVFHVSLKRLIRLVVLVKRTAADQPRFVLVFSTDTTLTAGQLIDFYSARFQIEFLFRDAKQLTGLTHCQARNQPALDFHFNAAFAAVNLAKLETQPRTAAKPTPFSLASYKCRSFNQFCLERFISDFDLEAEVIKNHPNYAKFCELGTLAS